MAQSIEQCVPMPAMLAMCEVPVAALPELSATALELAQAQLPEQVTADRWTAADAHLVSILLSK